MLDFSITFVFTLVNIGILFLILRKIFFKPVSQFIEARTAKIKGDIAQAEQENAAAKTLKKQYEDQIAASHEEAAALIRNAREAAENEAAAIIAEAKTQAGSLLAAARQQIEAEHRAAFAIFKAEAATLVLAASRKLLSREINADDRRREAEQFLKDLAEGA
jgi:F-type H+-transporting ATPase subunit b